MMSWSGSVYECRLCTTLTWSNLNPPCISLFGRQTAYRWWLVRSCYDKQEVRCRVSINLNRFCYDSQRYTLAVVQFFGKYLNTHLRFTVYGRKHGRIDTHTSAQCSPVSVGLTQVHPNKPFYCWDTTPSNWPRTWPQLVPTTLKC